MSLSNSSISQRTTWVEEVKTESSKWIKTKGVEFSNFYWQKGFGAFSIGQSQVEDVKRYIRSQKERHRRVTFLGRIPQVSEELWNRIRRAVRLGLIPGPVA